MAHRITEVEMGSPAYRAGMRAGDELIAINGEIVRDFIDYQALSAQAALTVKTRAGEFGLRKGEYEDLGLSFETPMMSGVRMCANNCAFCFVDQLPTGARKSLSVKDDDWRMSLMMGNYVSLTNVSDVELERIIRRRVFPLYISVHAMNPCLRAELMGTPRAERLPAQLKRLAEEGIEFHAQAVLVPGVNDGPELARTIRELVALAPTARSLALVPVGITRHRQGLPGLRKYHPAEAAAVIDMADRWRETCLERLGTRFVFPSDEFYLAADRPLPSGAEYEDYAQIDDGVGMLRLLEEEMDEAYAEMGEVRPRGEKDIVIATGVSAAPFLDALLKTHPIPGARVRVRAIRNHFFGETVTVAGLVTGGDLTAQLSEEPCTHILITECMLRAEDNLFLDDLPLSEAIFRVGRPIIPVGRRGGDLLKAIIDIVEE
jgi:putative radical SAM enzyme (TIGR03279 family)